MLFIYLCFVLESASASVGGNVAPLINFNQVVYTRISRTRESPSRSAAFSAVQDSREVYQIPFLNKKLSHLKFESCRPPEGIASLLNGLDNLEELSLICLSLSESDIEAILRLKKLRYLDLRGCRLDGKQLFGLIQSSVLEVIDLRGSSLQRSEIKDLQRRCPKQLLLIVDR